MIHFFPNNNNNNNNNNTDDELAKRDPVGKNHTIAMGPSSQPKQICSTKEREAENLQVYD